MPDHALRRLNAGVNAILDDPELRLGEGTLDAFGEELAAHAVGRPPLSAVGGHVARGAVVLQFNEAYTIRILATDVIAGAFYRDILRSAPGREPGRPQ